MKAKYVNNSYLPPILLLAGISPAVAQKFTGRTVLGEQHARQQVLSVIDQASKEVFYKPILPTAAIAIAVAEPLLFNIYGKQHILQERPYEAYLVNGYWYISGTLPKDYLGGTFEIILAASDARVMHVTHYK